MIANEELQTEREDKDLNQSLNAYKQEMKTEAKKNDFLLMVDDNNENINGKVVGKKVTKYKFKLHTYIFKNFDLYIDLKSLVDLIV